MHGNVTVICQRKTPYTKKSPTPVPHTLDKAQHTKQN